MVFRLQLLLAVLPSALGLVRPNDVGKLPALGWNSWNAYACDISEEKFLTAAQAVIDLGLQEAGYEYINVDDCWSVEAGRNNITHELIPDPTKFPDGINGTAAKIHAMGFKMGIYSSAGLTTCGGYPASLGFEEIDAASWAAWGIDYLKYDNCGVPSNWTDSCTACVPDSTNVNDYVNGTCSNTTGLCSAGFDYSTSLTAERYQRMRDALVAQNRTILFSLCDWGQADVQTWGNDTGNSWRTTGDITADWARVVEIMNENSFELNAVNFWGHNDPDMLEVGNGNLTFAETRSHFAFWAAMKSPLLIGTDLSTLSQQNVDILKNKYLLAFNQDDVFGASAIPYKWGTNPDWTFNSTYPAEFWSGASTNGTLVLMLNPDATNATRLASWAEIPELDATASYQVTDAWTDSDLGCLSSGINVTVAGHDTAVLLLKEC